MQFFKGLVRNLLILFVIGIGLLILFPVQMRQVFELYGALFGPGLILLIIVVGAMPRRRRQRR